ncbi:MAG TPA: cytochrome C oxidase subunit IV family protein [Nitrososphaerales archaeon]|nr:cytochrome C oxidase subunit IV family protein [Nitrososphaerales archaeon]HEV2225456.1 cytochrome C oxidase subunit IV family protein [Nitrososphaerales archaeon]
MRTSIALGVWAYMVVAVLAEVEAFYMITAYSTAAAVITVLATSQAVAVVLFYMQLKDEPGSLRLFALIPIMFLSALLIAMLASLG